MIQRAVVIPVRLSIGPRVLQSTSRALDADGIFVRCIAPPLTGARVELRLYLPGGPPEDLRGVVVAEKLLRDVGCRVQFVAPTESQRSRLMQLFSPVMLPYARAPTPHRSPGAQFELRALARVPVELRVQFESVDVLSEQLAVDLSAGGMFVRCELQPELDEEVRLLFELPGDEAPPLACKALIVRRVTEHEALASGMLPGVGVQFIEADDLFRARLDSWLARAQGLTPLE